MINKLLSIITEGEEMREGEGLLNCCRWKSLGRRGPGDGGGASGKGGVWSRWRFLGALTWRRSEAPTWRRSKAPVCRRTRRM
jgi:hypothetical protein